VNVELFRPIDFNSGKLCTDKLKLVIIGRENLNSDGHSEGQGLISSTGHKPACTVPILYFSAFNC